MLLEDITKIIIGVVLKRKEIKYKTDKSYEYKIFNLKSYEEKTEYDSFYSEESLENFIARKGDILFRLSFPLKVISVNDEIEGKLINNQYCIIREKANSNYNIEFIKWFLESDKAKVQFEKKLIGTTVKSISVSELRKIEIPQLLKSEQEKIIKISSAWDKQKQLYKEIIEKKEKYYNFIVNKFIDGGRK